MVSGCSEVLCRKTLPLLLHYCLLNCLTIVLKPWCASTVIFLFLQARSILCCKKPHVTIEGVGHYFLLPQKCIGIKFVF